MDGIREMVRDIDAARAVVYTSVLTKTEIFHKLKTQWAKDEYTRFFQRPNTSVVNQDERIGDKSSEIREYYTRKGITLDAGDCVHLATAILYKADVFYTLDGHSTNPKPNALLLLNGNVAGHPLSIRVPHAEQGSLFTGIPRQAVSSAITPAGKTPLKIVKSNPGKPPKP
jgi:predicted nucleic acid-binding protein